MVGPAMEPVGVSPAAWIEFLCVDIFGAAFGAASVCFLHQLSVANGCIGDKVDQVIRCRHENWFSSLPVPILSSQFLKRSSD